MYNTNYVPPGSDDIDQVIYCGSLLPGSNSYFLLCMDALGPELVRTYYDSCAFDVGVLINDKTKASEMACSILEMVVKECAVRGVKVHRKWRNKSKCRKCFHLAAVVGLLASLLNAIRPQHSFSRII